MHHLIFEGPEMAGKSWIMSQVYNHLEPKYATSKNVMDGCYWLPSDIGVFGTKHGKKIIKSYLEIFKELKNKNLIMEKLHISDIIYNEIYVDKKINYSLFERELLKLNFKIILITYPNDKKILKERIKGRLDIYPHYKRILKNIDWYLEQRKKYLEEIQKSKLPYLIVETTKLPDDGKIDEILSWIEEK